MLYYTTESAESQQDLTYFLIGFNESTKWQTPHHEASAVYILFFNFPKLINPQLLLKLLFCRKVCEIL